MAHPTASGRGSNVGSLARRPDWPTQHFTGLATRCARVSHCSGDGAIDAGLEVSDQTSVFDTLIPRLATGPEPLLGTEIEQQAVFHTFSGVLRVPPGIWSVSMFADVATPLMAPKLRMWLLIERRRPMTNGHPNPHGLANLISCCRSTPPSWTDVPLQTGTGPIAAPGKRNPSRVRRLRPGFPLLRTRGSRSLIAAAIPTRSRDSRRFVAGGRSAESCWSQADGLDSNKTGITYAGNAA